jgi:ubiquinone biosynthesis UbiH/UbiF/VisC/COQ6 family hydroxylase
MRAMAGLVSRVSTAPASAATADVVVHGGGAVGMAAALACAHLGLAVDWHGSAAGTVPAAGDDVRAYALNPASVELLRKHRVWDALPADARTAVHDMHIVGDDSRSALDFGAYSMAVGELAWIVDAAELEAALSSALRFAANVRSRGPLDAATAVPAADAGVLQVLADGRDGSGRAALGIGIQRFAYGHAAIAARLESTLPHAHLARQWFRHPDVLALLPLDRPTPGHGLALVWSVPEVRAAELQVLDDPAFETELAAAVQGGGGPALGLKLASPRRVWPLQLARVDAVSGPGWVLIGDAAHVVHPLAGQGLNLGLADVAALADVLAGREAWRPLGDERLLARYARRRAGDTLAMSLATDGLWQLFARDEPALKWLRNRGLALVDRLPPLKRALAAQALGR